jgi:rare lipoprotein A
MEQYTAAHRTLPFDTWVRVRNLTNDRQVDVRINDRGPFIKGRVIDLSRAAARTIEMIGPGTAPVRVEILAPPASAPNGADGSERAFLAQIGAFEERPNAERLRDAAHRRFPPARIVERDGEPVMWRVIVGSPMTLQEALRLVERIEQTFGSAFVVRHDQVEPSRN